MEKLKVFFEKPNRMPVSLSVHLFRYLIGAVGGVGLVYFCTALLAAQILSSTGVILPANAIEQSVPQRIVALSDGRPVDVHIAEGLFDDMYYAVFDTDEVLIHTNMPDAMVTSAKELAENPYDAYQELQGITVSRKITAGDNILVLRYIIDASFTNAWMRARLPSPRTCMIVLILILSLLWLLCFTGYTGKRLRKELARLEHVTEKIAERNLDFTPEQTNVTEFNRMLDAITSMRDALKASLLKEWETEAAKQRQINALVHDIKTPLTVAKGNAELLMERGLNTVEREYTEQLCGSIEKIYRYVEDILSVAKHPDLQQEGVGEISVSRFEDMASGIAAFAGKEKSLRLKMTIEQNVHSLPIEEKAAERVLQNLLENAARYAPANSVIRLDVLKDENNVKISVTDEGPGFSDEALRHAGELFWQDDKSRTNGRHHGLGIASVKQIASGLGGEVSLKNADNGGACVELLIPGSPSHPAGHMLRPRVPNGTVPLYSHYSFRS